MRTVILFLLVLICTLPSCEEHTAFYIKEIKIDKTIIAQEESVNISADLEFYGDISYDDIDFRWSSNKGRFEDTYSHVTFWTAPDDFTGDIVIALDVAHGGITETGSISIKVVQSSADKYGSISGYLIDEEGEVLKDVDVITVSGEEGTTDSKGFFFINNIPQGETGLTFSDIDYDWMADIQGKIEVIGGSHKHLQNIVVYHNIAPALETYEVMPERKSRLFFNSDYRHLYRYYELYKSAYSNSTSQGTHVRNVDPYEESIIVENSADKYYYSIVAVPYNGVPSERSTWHYIKFQDSVDPDPDYSFFEMNNFFKASLNWNATGYEHMLKGFQIAKLKSSYWEFISEILPPSKFTYGIDIYPGASGIYYVISISSDGSYNNSQPQSQRIELEVPLIQYPYSFYGNYNSSNNSIVLEWNKVSENIDWYSGYKLERTTATEPTENDWIQVSDLNSPYYVTFTDHSVSAGLTYTYRIRSYATPPGGGTPIYSAATTRTIKAS